MQHSSLALPSSPVGHVARVLIVVLGTAVVVLGVGMPAARAHDELIATTPAAGAGMSTVPATVTLEFSRAVQPLGTQVVVTGPDGAPVSKGAADVQGATVVQPLHAGGGGDGVHTVVWRVTASDGHPLSGQFSFTVAEGAPPSSRAATSSPAEDLDEAAVQRPAQSSSPVGPAAVGALLLVVAGAVLLLLRRRRT